MTANPDVIAMADRIAREQWPCAFDYPERDAARAAALLAIQETTERAANWYDYEGYLKDENEVADLLRQFAHLKGADCRYCGGTGKTLDRVDGEITCVECGYEKGPSHDT